MRRTRKQWAEHRNEQRCLAECQELVDAGEAAWLKPKFELLRAAEALALTDHRWLAEPEPPPEPEQLRLEAA